ncbi:RNA-binding ATPase activator esf2 [Phlyctochytrium planicorne]|nr:RNA-binding ATPase activator esf2 [Phlyctochytrium planicorne]
MSKNWGRGKQQAQDASTAEIALSTTHKKAATATAKKGSISSLKPNKPDASEYLVSADMDNEVGLEDEDEFVEKKVKGSSTSKAKTKAAASAEHDDRFANVSQKFERVKQKLGAVIVDDDDDEEGEFDNDREDASLDNADGELDEEDERETENGVDKDKISNQDDGEGEDEDDDDDDDDDDEENGGFDESHLPPGDQTDILNNSTNAQALKNDTKSSTPQKPITLESLRSLQSRIHATGVCYLSRIPPFMKPQVLRSLLSQHGRIGRIYLNPEDPKITARRKKYKKNRRVNYVEGWVEFEDKKLARRAAEFLNARNIGGKKGSRYYDDLWSIKYLPRFKWHHLTDQIAYERAVRDQKIRAEMQAVKRENKAYLRNVSKSKMIEAIESRKSRQRQGDIGSGIKRGSPDDSEITIEKPWKVRKVEDGGDKKTYERKFRQRKPITKNEGGEGATSSGFENKMLRKILG